MYWAELRGAGASLLPVFIVPAYWQQSDKPVGRRVKNLYEPATRSTRRARQSLLAACSLAISLVAGSVRAEPKSPLVGESVEVARVVASQASYDAWGHRFSANDEALLEEIQHGCFNYFWNEVGQPACLALDKTTDTISSIAAVGFQLSSLPIGVEHGWVTHQQAEDRALTILRALINRSDNKKFGVYFHFIDADTGGKPDFSKTRRRYELMAGTVDHALFQAGVMTAAEYFGGKVKQLADALIADVNWAQFRHGPTNFLSMGWKATTDAGVEGPGKMWPWIWKRASDEERIIYFLAVGAERPDFAVPAEDYFRLERSAERYADDQPFVTAWSGGLFMFFFSHCWIDYGGFQADNPRQFGVDNPRVDWFENSRRAALTHRRRCIEAKDRFPTLGENRWGLSPCAKDGGYCVPEFQPNLVDNDRWCDGVVPPYAAASVLPMAPREAMAALREYRSLKASDGKPLVWRDPASGGYGFVDSFKLDPPQAFEVYLGIDQGPMLLAIENARTGLIWRLFMNHPVAKTAVGRLKLEPRKKTWTASNN